MIRRLLSVTSLLLCSLAQGELLSPPISLTAEQNYTTNPDQSLVKVSGQVDTFPESATGKQPALMASNLTVISPDAQYGHSGLQPAVGVTVRFWQPDSPGRYYTAQTDEQGNYLIGLSEGVWLGEACGSGIGFYPAAWRLSIVDEKLISMQAITQKSIQLNPLEQNLFDRMSQESVTLTGSGFGCNGALVFTYSNAVNRCGITQSVEYDQEVIRVSDFRYRSDTELRFPMPVLHPDSGVMRHIASVHYEQGRATSEGVVIGERVMVRLPGTLCQGEELTENNRVIIQDDVVVMSDGRVTWREPHITNRGQPLLGREITEEITTRDLGIEISIRELQGVEFGKQPAFGLQLKLKELR